MNKYLKYFRNTLLIAIIMVVSLNVGALMSGPISAKESSAYQYLEVFSDAMSIIKQNYVEEVKTKDLIYGAINGMLSSLDPHSSFMSPESFKEMQVETKGAFGGLGIEITVRDGYITVVSPMRIQSG